MSHDLLKQSYYELFDIPLSYSIDTNDLQAKMRSLQQEYHPDNFASDESKSLWALSVSSHINHAYQTLAKPLERAIYLLSLNGIVVDLVHDTKFTSEFLLQQIELRENISDAENNGDIDKLELIDEEIKLEINQLEFRIAKCFEENDHSETIEHIKKLSFYSRLSQLVDNTISNL